MDEIDGSVRPPVTHAPDAAVPTDAPPRAMVFGGDLGVAYLGTQGDVWDAQEDMLLATLGSAIAVATIAARRRRRRALPDVAPRPRTDG